MFCNSGFTHGIKIGCAPCTPVVWLRFIMRRELIMPQTLYSTFKLEQYFVILGEKQE